MIQRILIGGVAIIAVLSIVMIDVGIAMLGGGLDGPLARPLGSLLSRGSVIPIVWLCMILVSATELNRMLRLQGCYPPARFVYLMIAALILTPWLAAAGWMGQGAAHVEGMFCLGIVLIAAGIGSGLVAVARRRPEGTLRDVGAAWLMLGYLGFLGAFALQLRCGRDTPAREGAWLLLILILTTKASDIGAYFVGSLLGRHKLCPSISPAKSVEGAIGGLLASGLVAMLFVWTHTAAVDFISGPGPSGANPLLTGMLLELMMEAAGPIADATRAFGTAAGPGGLSPLLWAFLFGLIMSALGQIGDLFESCLKRDAGVKDSGELIPRYGGILDLMDSPLFATPVGWFLLTAV